MDNNNPVRYSDLISPDDSVEKLVKQLDDLSSSLQFVQKSAVTLKESMVTTSGATDSGREAIAKASKEADKLAKAQADLAFAQSEAGRKLAEYKAQIAEVSAENKRLAKTVDAAAGSFDDLSATYSRLKSELNKMAPKTKEEAATFAEMQKRAAEVRAEMDRLQKATGNYSISVGNYKEGTQELIGVQKSMRTEIRDVKEELARLNLAGDTTSERYKELVARAGQLTDAMGDASQAAHKAASDTSNLDAALGLASVASGGFAVAEGALSALGIETEGVEKAERKLMGAISMVNGVQAIANALNKDGALRIKIMAVSQKLLAKATTATSTATKGASLAMKGLKAAMISTGIGALVVALGIVIEKIMDFVENSKKANEELTKTQEKIKTAGESLKKTYDDLKTAKQNYKNAVREAAEAVGGDKVVLENLNKDLAENKKKYDEASGAVSVYTASVERSKAAVDRFQKEYDKNPSKENADVLLAAQEALAANRGYLGTAELDKENAKTKDVELNRKVAETKNKIDEDAAKKKEEAAKKIEEAEKERDAEEAIRAANRLAADAEIANKARENEKQNLELLKDDTAAYLDERGRLTTKWYEDDVTAEKKRYKEQLANHKAQGITLEQVETLHNANKLSLQRQYAIDLDAIDKDITDNRNVQTVQALEDAKAARELEIEGIKATEKKKEKLRIQAEIDYQTKRLELARQGVIKMTEAEISQIEISLASLRKDFSNDDKAESIWDMLGFNLDAAQTQTINTAINTAMENVKSLTQTFVDLKTSALESSKARTEAAKTALDAEIEAREKGLANNIDTAQKEYAAAKRNQEKALSEQKKAQRAQALLDSATQASSLITASADIWKAWGKMPPVAIAAIATMWGSFGAAKIKAAQVTKSEKYGDGTVELLNGGSHQSGNDIDLGTKKDGTRRRAEGGEYFAVINRRSSRKYKSVIPNVIKALNDGTFEAKNLNANARIGGVNISVGDIGKTADLRNVEKGINNIYEQSKSRIFVDAKGNTVIQSNGYTQVIKR